MQCPAGELAMRVDKQELESGNVYYRYASVKRNVRTAH